jgi:hypothetical protein
MGFQSGSISCRRFKVVGDGPETADESLLSKLKKHALKPTEIGIPDEAEYGWSGGRHVLDDVFSFDNNVYADAVIFGLRVDTHKVPAELKKAYQAIEETALAKKNKSGFISKDQKKEAKENVLKRIEAEMRDGRYRRSKLTTLLWDLTTGTLYGAVSGKTFELLAELFERTFGLSLLPVSAGSLALSMLEPRGRRRDYEDARPTRIVPGPEGESQFPEYPWTLKGAEPKDFLGNEFLLWAWHEAETKDGIIRVEGTAANRDVSLMIDRSLDLDCAYGQTGRDGLRGDGPGRMPEARDAVRTGKVPRKAGLLVSAAGLDFSLTINAESLAIGSAKLPDIEEAQTPRVEFEERIGLLRDLTKTIDKLFEAFLKIRLSAGWEGQVTSLRRWAVQANKAVTVAA